MSRTRTATDLEKLRVALRRLSREALLTIAERATELVPGAKLGTLVGDLVRMDDLAKGKTGVRPLLDEVRKFHEAALKGVYYDSFDVNSRNYMAKSEGTEEFIAEFERLIGKCISSGDRRAGASPRQGRGLPRAGNETGGEVHRSVTMTPAARTGPASGQATYSHRLECHLRPSPCGRAVQARADALAVADVVRRAVQQAHVLRRAR